MADAAPQLNPLWLKASFIFVLVGLSAKIGLAPMHPADIDATSNAPAPVAALMAGSLRSTAVLVLLAVLSGRLSDRSPALCAEAPDFCGPVLACRRRRLYVAQS